MTASSILSTVPAAGLALILGSLAYRALRQHQVARVLEIRSPNRIVEGRYVRIGGIEQWIQIRGEDRENPVLLILHGGPGWPNTTFTLPLRAWEKDFTLVQWDQRGAGKTLRRSGQPGREKMTFACRVSDAVELAEYLCRYLGKQKLVLLAESMGTLTGLPLAKQRPDLFSAVVVTDLYVDVPRNEALKRRLTRERLREQCSFHGMAALDRLDPDPRRWSLRDWNTSMGWAFKTNRPIPNLDRALLFPLVLFSPLYSLRDLYYLFAGFQASTAGLFEEIIAYDARQLGNRFEVPFFLFQGDQDVITLTGLAEEYFAEVDAPLKGMERIVDAGHFAAFTQPETFLNALRARVLPAITAESCLTENERKT